MGTRERINRTSVSSADKKLLRQLFTATPSNAEAIQRTVRNTTSFSRDDKRALVQLATLFQATGGDLPAAKQRAKFIINDMHAPADIKRALRLEFAALS
jgi:hypothetical protein